MTIRRAVVGDAAELTRLRALMFESMGRPIGPGFGEICTASFMRRLSTPGFAAYVVDGERPGSLCASGAGWVEERLVDSVALHGLVGHIASMSTDVSARRLGHARTIFAALVGFLTAEGVGKIELDATPSGDPLYASFGFAPSSMARTSRVPSPRRTTS